MMTPARNAVSAVLLQQRLQQLNFEHVCMLLVVPVLQIYGRLCYWNCWRGQGVKKTGDVEQRKLAPYYPCLLLSMQELPRREA
eukprot:15341607-Ditylum_brightwellii.AAC.1